MINFPEHKPYRARLKRRWYYYLWLAPSEVIYEDTTVVYTCLDISCAVKVAEMLNLGYQVGWVDAIARNQESLSHG